MHSIAKRCHRCPPGDFGNRGIRRRYDAAQQAPAGSLRDDAGHARVHTVD
jgi:hypothetical protein